MIKVAILKETKTPPDKRVAITPKIAKRINKEYPNIQLVAQNSELRCFSDKEYQNEEIKLQENIEDSDILIGVKEVKIEKLISGKKYMFFSHVAKKQPYNRPLLKAILDKKITLIDYEYLVNDKEVRVVAFGRWAGIVGAYNGIKTYGMRTKEFNLPDATQLKDLTELKKTIKNIQLPAIKILITGEGRVASGAIEVLNSLNIKKVSVNDFLNKSFSEAVLCQIGPDSYVKKIDGSGFDLMHFFKNPKEYKSSFLPFTKAANVYIPCHFWDDKSPKFMTVDDMKAPDFSIKVIADVSCDIADPIPSTLRPSTISEPFYDYNPQTEKEEKAFSSDNNISVMAVDNLPGSLPRDASEDFSEALFEAVFPTLFDTTKTEIVNKATIAKEGKLTDRYAYLQAYVDGKE